MKRIFFLASAIALFACNNTGQSSSGTETSTTNTPAEAHDHDHEHGHDHSTDGGMKQPVQEVKEGQEVFFANLKDGDVVKNPVIVKFGVKGMEVEKAGPITPDKGHHHLIIDGTPIPAGTTVPVSETCIHYGKGQTADTLDALTPGKHTLTMQFANGVHTSFGEKMSKTITIEVK